VVDLDVHAIARVLASAVVHSGVSVLFIKLAYDYMSIGPHISWIETLPVFLVLLVSIVLYLVTGVPGVVLRKCAECGEKVLIGKLRCGNCGNVTGQKSGENQKLS